MTDDSPARPIRAPRRSGRAPRRVPLWLAATMNLLAALLAVSLVQAFLVRVHTVSSGSMEPTLQVGDRVLSSALPYGGPFASPASSGARGPQRGDVVIFAHGQTWESERLERSSNPAVAAVRLFGDLTGIGVSNRVYTVKRVIGMPGDVVECCDAQGRVLVNGDPLDEPYVTLNLAFEPGMLDCSTTPMSTRCFGPIAVAEERYLVLGDHRSNSADSVAACRGVPVTDGCAVFVDRSRITGKVFAKAWPPGSIG